MPRGSAPGPGLKGEEAGLERGEAGGGVPAPPAARPSCRAGEAVCCCRRRCCARSAASCSAGRGGGAAPCAASGRTRSSSRTCTSPQ